MHLWTEECAADDADPIALTDRIEETGLLLHTQLTDSFFASFIFGFCMCVCQKPEANCGRLHRIGRMSNGQRLSGIETINYIIESIEALLTIK